MKSSGIGGQAVLEGIMMRNGGKYAVAVRKPDKEIVVDVKGHKGLTDKHKFLNIPFVRGVFNTINLKLAFDDARFAISQLSCCLPKNVGRCSL